MKAVNYCNHWSQVEWLHKTVKNKNIILHGTHSYYSGYFTGNFEETVVRYLYGDSYSTDPETGWLPTWTIDKLWIGDYVQIAAGVVIILGGNNTHRPDFLSTYPFFSSKSLQNAYLPKGDTVIGHDVWLGTNSIIMPGVTLGNGVIVAANSVVTKHVPAYSMVGGNPAKIIKKRFSEEEIQQLEKMQWWLWSEEKIAALLDLIQSNKISELAVADKLYDQSHSR